MYVREKIMRELLKNNIKKLDSEQESYIIEFENTELNFHRTNVFFGLIEDVEEDVFNNFSDDDYILEIRLEDNKLYVLINTNGTDYQLIIKITKVMEKHL